MKTVGIHQFHKGDKRRCDRHQSEIGRNKQTGKNQEAEKPDTAVRQPHSDRPCGAFGYFTIYAHCFLNLSLQLFIGSSFNMCMMEITILRASDVNNRETYSFWQYGCLTSRANRFELPFSGSRTLRLNPKQRQELQIYIFPIPYYQT